MRGRGGGNVWWKRVGVAEETVKVLLAVVVTASDCCGVRLVD